MSKNTNNKEKEVIMEIVRLPETKTITLPEDCSIEDAIKWLKRRLEEDEQQVAIHEDFDLLPLEGAWVLLQAVKSLYGWVDLRPTPGFFGETPPHMITYRISPTEAVEVPWGRVCLPGVDGYLQTGFGMQANGRLGFYVAGVTKNKHHYKVKQLLLRMRELATQNSPYKGKAIIVPFPDKPIKDLSPDDFVPEFMNLSGVNADDLVLSTGVQELVNASLFTPIEKTQACRNHGIPLKRGVLLHGPYGTGKTLTARVAAKKCVENGWTFIYMRDVSNLPEAIAFARKYQPAVVFAEDVDRVMAGELNDSTGKRERDEEMDNILNTIDGIDSKSTEIIVVLTSNDAERINHAMRRPGRLDAVIRVSPPDSQAVARLIELYVGPDRLGSRDGLEAVGEELAGQNAAVVREVCERAKLMAIARSGSADCIMPDDLLLAARGMAEQIRFMQETTPDTRSQREKAAELLGNTIGEHLVDAARQLSAPQHHTNGKSTPNGAVTHF